MHKLDLVEKYVSEVLKAHLDSDELTKPMYNKTSNNNHRRLWSKVNTLAYNATKQHKQTNKHTTAK